VSRCKAPVLLELEVNQAFMVQFGLEGTEGGELQIGHLPYKMASGGAVMVSGIEMVQAALFSTYPPLPKYVPEIQFLHYSP
jgi:hypothetical protein